MHVKVPNVNKCCFCIPLRYGILIFAYLNFLCSFLAVTFLVITTELKRMAKPIDDSVEIMTSAVLFSILIMGVILNLLLIIAGHQKDVSMLRLYNYYAMVTFIAALVPTSILMSRKQYSQVIASLFALAMQFYVIVLVNSETVKLELKFLRSEERRQESHAEEAVDINDRVILI